MEVRGLSVTASVPVRERRLADLLQGRDPSALGLREAVEEAQARGSLALARVPATDASVGAMRNAVRAVPRDAPLTVAALQAWHAAVVGAPSRFRTSAASAERNPGAAPPEFIAGRLAILEQWMGAESRGQLKPEQAGALALARIAEILPFEEGNGRVARLAASHVMVQGGARPPILVDADRERLGAAIEAAFQLATEPLATLLEQASTRALDVMIQALQ
jgi:hypothetical protein